MIGFLACRRKVCQASDLKTRSLRCPISFSLSFLLDKLKFVGHLVKTYLVATENVSRSGDWMKNPTVTIYTRPGCHLCEEAKAAILASGCDGEFALEEVNIDDDPHLRERYTYDIPVILIDGVKVFKHKVDPREFRRKLRRLEREG